MFGAYEGTVGRGNPVRGTRMVGVGTEDCNVCFTLISKSKPGAVAPEQSNLLLSSQHSGISSVQVLAPPMLSLRDEEFAASCDNSSIFIGHTFKRN